MSRPAVVMIAGAAVVILCMAAALWVLSSREEVPDELLRRVLANVPSTQAYTQQVVTETDIAGRLLRVEGIYHVDRANSRFSSSATTTLIIPDDEAPQIFNLMNISVGEDVYVKIQTEDEALRSRIPHSPDWLHFNRLQIPDSFRDIAIAGPILDNLLIFSEGGSYVRLVDIRGVEDWRGEGLARYSFTLGKLPDTIGGTLRTLFDRVGAGTVDIWVDPTHAEVRRMVVVSDAYRSETTFSNNNHIPDIVIPGLSSD